jgi:ACS family hexuronate transporter-like MFS transporter
MGFSTSGGSAIGAVVAPPAIVWTVIRTGWRGAFVLTGVIGALWLVFWLLTYSRPPRASENEAAPSAPVISWRELLRRRDVQGFVSSRFLFDPVFYFYMFWIPQYLSQVRGASLERIGQLTWIPFLTLGISSVFGGWISDRLVRSGVPVANARKYVMLASALLTPLSIMAVFVYTIETAIALMSVLMFAHGFWITNYMTIIGDLFPGDVVATVVGLTGTAGGVGGFLTSLLIGRVVQDISYTPVFIAAGVMYPLCALILFTTVVTRETSSVASFLKH